MSERDGKTLANFLSALSKYSESFDRRSAESMKGFEQILFDLRRQNAQIERNIADSDKIIELQRQMMDRQDRFEERLNKLDESIRGIVGAENIVALPKRRKR